LLHSPISLNSFYTEHQPEFTIAMGDFLGESGARANRPRVLQAVMRAANAKYEADIKMMRGLADESASPSTLFELDGDTNLPKSSRRAKRTR
jgi:hypothetical protein